MSAAVTLSITLLEVPTICSISNSRNDFVLGESAETRLLRSCAYKPRSAFVEDLACAYYVTSSIFCARITESRFKAQQTSALNAT